MSISVGFPVVEIVMVPAGVLVTTVAENVVILPANSNWCGETSDKNVVVVSLSGNKTDYVICELNAKI